MPSAPNAAHRLALALRAAYDDYQLQRKGVHIVFFFDADVIAGSLFARDKIETDLARRVPLTRSVVRSLWLQDRLPRVRLTIPHLLELEGVLRAIEQHGGVARFLSAQGQTISKEFGLTSGKPSTARLVKLLDALVSAEAKDERAIGAIIDNLGMVEFAIIEAELAARAFYQEHLLQKKIDLDGDTGESEPEIAGQVAWFQDVVTGLERIRPGRAKQNRTDAAALLAVSRLWTRDHASNTEYRFYTQTEAIRAFCEKSQLGRHVVTRPGVTLPADVPCTDAADSAIRSSTYFILRVAFESIGFEGTGNGDWQNTERNILAAATDSLLESASAEAQVSPTHCALPN